MQRNGNFKMFLCVYKLVKILFFKVHIPQILLLCT